MQPPAGLDGVQRAAWLRDAGFLAQLVDSNKVCLNSPPAILLVCCGVCLPRQHACNGKANHRLHLSRCICSYLVA
jgi:hypothetical protein